MQAVSGMDWPDAGFEAADPIRGSDLFDVEICFFSPIPADPNREVWFGMKPPFLLAFLPRFVP